MKNTASIFIITLASSHTFFYFGEYPSCENWRIFISETCFVRKYLKTYKKTKYRFPSSWNNLVHGERAAKISKQHKRLEKRRKNWCSLDLASTDQRECSEFEASQNARWSLKFDASISKFDASQRGLSSAINFFIAYKLNLIAIGYRRDLCMFKNHHFTKYFLKLAVVVRVCLCSEKREVNWNYFSFPVWTFTIKRKRKDAMSVSSCNSVNSAIMYNMEIMIKMPFVIRLISTAIMIIVFN